MEKNNHRKEEEEKAKRDREIALVVTSGIGAFATLVIAIAGAIATQDITSLSNNITTVTEIIAGIQKNQAEFNERLTTITNGINQIVIDGIIIESNVGKNFSEQPTQDILRSR